jgi:hypothetical protein
MRFVDLGKVLLDGKDGSDLMDTDGRWFLDNWMRQADIRMTKAPSRVDLTM